jgi:hypothetical protein
VSRAPAIKPGTEGLVVERIFRLAAQLNPGQRTAVAYALMQEATITDFAAQLQATSFPGVRPDLILAVVRATLNTVIPPT